MLIQRVKEVLSNKKGNSVITNILIMAIIIVAILAVANTIETGTTTITNSIITFIQDSLSTAFGN